MIVAVGTVGAGGWTAAIFYYKLNDKVTAIYTSAQLHEKTIEVVDLKGRLAKAESDKKRLSNALKAATESPTDRDWANTNYRFPLLYGQIIRAANSIELLEKWRCGNGPWEFYKISQAASVVDDLRETKKSVNAYCVGADLMRSTRVDGLEYVVLSKYPSYGVNWSTGQVKLLQPAGAENPAK